MTAVHNIVHFVVRLAGSVGGEIAFNGGIVYKPITDSEFWLIIRATRGTVTVPAPPMGRAGNWSYACRATDTATSIPGYSPSCVARKRNVTDSQASLIPGGLRRNR